jgi:hypothetical protein
MHEAVVSVIYANFAGCKKTSGYGDFPKFAGWGVDITVAACSAPEFALVV